MEPVSNAFTTRAPSTCPAPSADINAELARPPVQAPSPPRSRTAQPKAVPSSTDKPEAGVSSRLDLLHCKTCLQPARSVCAIESKQPFLLCMCLAPARNISEKNTAQSGVLEHDAHWGCSARRAHREAGRSASARRRAVSRLRHPASCHGSPTVGWKCQTDSGSGSGGNTPQHLCGKGRTLHR